MGKLVGVLDTSHVWIHRPIEEWDAVRASRRLRDDVPEEDTAEKAAKFDRVSAAVEVLKDKLAQWRPDALVIFGDDQSENFSNTFVNIPSIAIYVGPTFAGRRYDSKPDEPHQEVATHEPLARSILSGLLRSDFDPAFCMGLPNPDRGIGHAIMNPLGYFTDYTVPAVPVLLNALFAPQISARRANALGRAVRRIVDQYPDELRVVAIGSGGLWHTTSHGYNTYLNEEFDRTNLDFLAKGDLSGLAEHFDSYRVADDDMSQYIGDHRGDTTGMTSPGGPQFGTRETLNWIAASSTAEGSPFTVVDYVPIYSSPIGACFAYCEL
jgi:Catalytic LigB subunit of aromatic ring-opening dioxygenase